jgi:uncharacterized protein YcfJ
MAQNLVVNFIGNNKLSKTTAAVSADLKKFQRTADNVGRGLNRALGAAGLAVGFAALTRVLKQSAKAASEDIKSQALLSNALKNTTGASDVAIKSAESYIRKTQLSAAVLDTELRPALSQAVRATGSLAGGQALLDTALDVSAGTGKDLGTVVGALSKAYTGNTTSLKKLIPGIDVTGDYMSRLNKTFEGAAETAANNDPYKKIGIIFSELQETIGMTLLPAIQEFSDYLSSDEGQSNLQSIANIFGVIGKLITNATSFLIQNANIIIAVVAGLVALKVGWFAVTFAVKAYELATKLAKIQTIALRTAIISTGIGALVVAVATLGAMWYAASESANEYADAQDNATNSNQLTFTNINRGFRDPVTGMWDSALKRTLSDSRITKEMKNVIAKFKGKEVTIDFGLNAIFVNKKMVWKGLSQEVKEVAEKVREALDKEVSRVKSTAEKFRDAIGLAFGTRGEDENSIFNVDFLIGKMKRIAQAAKGFAENLASLRKRGADQSFINEIVAMGPAQGNIVAKSLLQSPGKLSEILGLRGEIYGVGAQAQVQSSLAGNATYEININKAVISASDIIREIKILEKKTGRKYLVN